jgi:hypothetical protein
MGLLCCALVVNHTIQATGCSRYIYTSQRPWPPQPPLPLAWPWGGKAGTSWPPRPVRPGMATLTTPALPAFTGNILMCFWK